MDMSFYFVLAKEKLIYYLGVYWKWLMENLNPENPFKILSFAAVAFFLLVVYIWFRHRD